VAGSQDQLANWSQNASESGARDNFLSAIFEQMLAIEMNVNAFIIECRFWQEFTSCDLRDLFTAFTTEVARGPAALITCAPRRGAAVGR
jgi:hypothetical protein